MIEPSYILRWRFRRPLQFKGTFARFTEYVEKADLNKSYWNPKKKKKKKIGGNHAFFEDN